MNEEGMNLLKDMDLLPTPGEIPGEELDEPEVTTRDFTAEDEAIASLMKRAPEPLKALVRYYHSISVIHQPLFALMSSMAAGGEVLSRNWITAALKFTAVTFPPSTLNDNYLMTAPTGHGKETPKVFMQGVVPEFESSRGMSVDTALHTALQQFPRFVLFIDEAGKRAAEAMTNPNKNTVETLLMEIYSNTGTRTATRAHTAAPITMPATNTASRARETNKIPMQISFFPEHKALPPQKVRTKMSKLISESKQEKRCWTMDFIPPTVLA